MIAYRDVTVRVTPTETLSSLKRLADASDATGFLVEAGELEQAAVDGISPVRDGWGDIQRRLRAMTLAAGAAFVASRIGDPVAAGGAAKRPASADTHPALQAALRELEGIPVHALPSSLEVRLPEGYGHYGLDPAAYAAAAVRYAADVGLRRARRAMVVGVRSIGTSLSAVVAAVTGGSRSFTVRPRGVTGSRHVRVDAVLRHRLMSWLEDDPDVLVVDEGPGATGETFACTLEWLRSEGVPEERVVFFPSHNGGMPLAPPDRRAEFQGMRKYLPAMGDDRPARMAARLGLDAPVDIGGGRWRAHVDCGGAPPARPFFERPKYLTRDARGERYVLRYAGLGRWGAATATRARLLRRCNERPASEISDGVLEGTLEDGYIALHWYEGVPLARGRRSDPLFVTALTSYLAARAGRFQTGVPVDQGPVIAMLVENAREAARMYGATSSSGGSDTSGLSAARRRLENLPVREAAIPDGRLQPWEWIGTQAGFVKVDALDHGNGVRFPGPSDPAWDIAGAAVEYALGEEAVLKIVKTCATPAAESEREFSAAVSAYRVPYAAAAFGDAGLAAREVISERDRCRLFSEALFYASALEREMCRAAAIVSNP